MPSSFQAKKQKIVSSLSASDEDYTDASPKGSVDAPIRELVSEINNLDGYVTTSSCSGRIAVYVEGASAIPARDLGQDEARDTPKDGLHATKQSVKPTGGKGGGKWLFTSHDSIDVDHFTKPGAVLQFLGLPSTTETSCSPPNKRPQFVHFKFEPMILHILAEDAQKAQRALNAAMTAGFRESGISSLFDSKERQSSPMVAVRSSGLALDSIIGFIPAQPEDEIQLMVTEAYLKTLLQIANERFEVNAQRTERFRSAFLAPNRKDDDTHAHGAESAAYEPTEARKDRMRREGLEKKRALAVDKAHRANNAPSNGLIGSDGEVEDPDFNFEEMGIIEFADHSPGS